MNYYRVSQNPLIPNDTVLTVAGGATPAVTGSAFSIENIVSPVSLILVNDGTSTSLSVTYQIGFVNSGDEGVAPTVTWVTPADGGAVADLTAANIAGSYKHASISLAVAKYYRFIVTNNDATGGHTATVCLFGICQW